MFVRSDGGVCFGSSGSSNRNLFTNKPKTVTCYACDKRQPLFLFRVIGPKNSPVLLVW
jgi:hypothetical protein